MSWIITLITGLFMGWLAGLISVGIIRGGMFVNLINGVAGSIFGYWLFVDVFGFGLQTTALGYFSMGALIWEIIGAIIFLIIVNAVYYGDLAAKEKRSYRSSEVAHEYKKRSRRK